MAFAYASLASGQLPNAKATIYTSVGETAVKQITLVTTDASAHTVNIYLKESAGTSRRIIPKDLPMDSTSSSEASQVECLENTMEMSAGDVIEGDADTAAVIDYVITGATR